MVSVHGRCPKRMPKRDRSQERPPGHVAGATPTPPPEPAAPSPTPHVLASQVFAATSYAVFRRIRLVLDAVAMGSTALSDPALDAAFAAVDKDIEAKLRAFCARLAEGGGPHARGELLRGAGFADEAALDPQAKAQAEVGDRSSRPLGFSYRPRREWLATGSPHVVNAAFQCLEPARRRLQQDDSHVISNPRRAMLFAIEDVTTAEAVRRAQLRSGAAHLRRHGTLAGVSPLCNPSMRRVCDAAGLGLADSVSRQGRPVEAVVASVARDAATSAAVGRSLLATTAPLTAVCLGEHWEAEAAAAVALFKRSAAAVQRHFLCGPGSLPVLNTVRPGPESARAGLPPCPFIVTKRMLLHLLAEPAAVAFASGVLLPMLCDPCAPAALLEASLPLADRVEAAADPLGELPVASFAAAPVDVAAVSTAVWPATRSLLHVMDTALAVLHCVHHLVVADGSVAAVLRLFEAVECWLEPPTEAEWRARLKARYGHDVSTASAAAIPRMLLVLRQRCRRALASPATCTVLRRLLHLQASGSFAVGAALAPTLASPVAAAVSLEAVDVAAAHDEPVVLLLHDAAGKITCRSVAEVFGSPPAA